MSMLAYFLHETRVYRRSGTLSLPLVFACCALSLMCLGVSLDRHALARLGPYFVWITFFLSSLFSFERLIQADVEDGTFDWLRNSRLCLERVCLAKALSHWFCTQLPLIFMVPLFALLLNMPLEGVLAILLALTLGTWSLSFWGLFCACLTMRLPHSNMLTSLLLSPLVLPTLIFGSCAQTHDYLIFVLLGALSVFAALLAPICSAWVLHLDDQ